MAFSSNTKDMQGILVNEYNTVNENILAKSTVEDLKLKKAGLITTYALEQNYPNPFNPTTTITYQLPKDGAVTLKIYDILGREVKTLVNEYKPAGSYSVTFNASNLASGVYIYQLKSGDFIANKKLVLMK